MRVSLAAISLLAVTASASSWFSGKSAYSKWHDTDLERWLADHDIPYPTPGERKQLEEIVNKNWNKYSVKPYEEWDPEQLNAFLTLKGIEVKSKTDKPALVKQVESSWYETEDKAQESWFNVKDWILDTWSESQLKAFADKHGIPVPQPRTRDSLVAQIRNNYDSAAKKAGEVSSYPGNWLYESWSESDLKEWLDTHGFPAPQPTNRDKLIAHVRRNSRIAYLKSQDQAASATASAQAAWKTVTGKIIDSWTESDMKKFADKNGIKVPHGSKGDELRAYLRQQSASAMGDTVTDKVSSVIGAATSKVGDQYAQATDSAANAASDAFDAAVAYWSESRLKAFLDSRGIPVPQASKKDELRALVRKHHYKASTGWNAWTFDDYSTENLKDYIVHNGDKNAKAMAKKVDASREDLVSAAQSAYASASSAGGGAFASVTSYLAKQTGSAKAYAFDSWTDSELKRYLDSFGVPVPQGSTTEELKALARKQGTYFKYGTSTPTGTMYAKLSESVQQAWHDIIDKIPGMASTPKAHGKIEGKHGKLEAKVEL